MNRSIGPSVIMSISAALWGLSHFLLACMYDGKVVSFWWTLFSWASGVYVSIFVAILADLLFV